MNMLRGDLPLPPNDSPLVTPRIAGYDLARALAVFGMVVVNYYIVSGLDRGGAETWFTRLGDVLCGRAAVLFMLLAGVGMTLLSRRAVQSGSPHDLAVLRRRLAARCLLLMMMGAAFRPFWDADILHFYGVYLFIGLFLLRAPDRRLWMLITAILAVSVYLMLCAPYRNLWDDAMAGLGGGTWAVNGLDDLFVYGFYPAFPWLAFLIAGMWLGRRDFRRPGRRRAAIAAGLSVLAAVEAGSLMAAGLPAFTGLQGDRYESLSMVVLSEAFPVTLPFVFSAVAGNLVVILVCLGLDLTRRGWYPVLAVGRMSLTIYVTHIFFGLAWMHVAGRLKPAPPDHWMALGAAVFCLLSLAASPWWMRRFGRGPLEILMQRGIDWLTAPAGSRGGARLGRPQWL